MLPHSENLFDTVRSTAKFYELIIKSLPEGIIIAGSILYGKIIRISQTLINFSLLHGYQNEIVTSLKGAYCSCNNTNYTLHEIIHCFYFIVCKLKV